MLAVRKKERSQHVRTNVNMVGITRGTAYGLTAREQTITALVCQGLPTRQIASQLHLTTDTVQDHLKSVFDRTGVRSRGELVATILRRDYLPHAMAGDPLNRAGAFTPAPQ
jgi:DNA-binding NarL/FixJ family response regulator